MSRTSASDPRVRNALGCRMAYSAEMLRLSAAHIQLAHQQSLIIPGLSAARNGSLIFFPRTDLTNDFTTKVLLTAIRDTIDNKPLQWTATKDIGFFGAEAFRDPSKWNKRAFSIANDVLTFPELNQKFVDVTGKPAPTTFSIFASAFKWGVADLGFMIDWYKAEGFNANIAENRRLNPNYTTFESWLKQSVFAKTK